jgi:serine phosphatase RsbU (regulator of sigma subunit)/anti-sigma regulatory factor (Ser/Thr protein kinase)
VVQPTLHAEADERRRDSWSVIAKAARAIHAEREPRKLIAWVVETARAESGAEAAGLWVFDDGSPAWVTSGTPAADPSLLGDPRSWSSLDTTLQSAAIVAVNTDEGVEDERLHRLLPGIGLLAVPVISGHDILRGVLVLTSRGAAGFDEGTRQLVEALASHLGVALDNLDALIRLAHLEASQRSVVRQLQEAVLPPIPTVPHTELGMHYVPSDEAAPTGGDLHDWVVLADGTLHLAVVDIMGKGVAATKDALAVTHALRLLVSDGCPLEQLVARADQLVTAQSPELVATVIVGRYDPTTGLLRLVGGGHPPALLVSNGVVSELSAPGIAIGWPGAGSFRVAEVTLDRSDTVVMYTDGLIEATKDIVVGLETLARYAAETAGYPAPSMARALVDRALRGVARHDDSLALVVRRRTPPAIAGRHVLGPFEHHFTPNGAGVSLARHLLEDWVVRVPVEADATDDILLVASELCSNAVRHASGQPGGVALRAWVDGADIVLEVEDDGGGMSWPEALDELPDPDAEQGRGLFLVHALSDDVSSEISPQQTVVRAVKRAVVGSA